LLLPLVFWALWVSHRQPAIVAPWTGAILYLLSLGFIVILMRRLARRAMRVSSNRATARFHHGMFAARWVVMSLHLFALFYLGWGDLIVRGGLAFDGRVESLPALTSMLPVALAWIGLIWAQYPLDRAVREQNIMLSLNEGDAIYEPPSIGAYVLSNTRLQVLALLVPVGLAIILRDVATLGLIRWTSFDAADREIIATFAGAGFVFVIGPEILRRILPVNPMPDSPLRQRLEGMCERLGLRYRDILIWRTHFAFCNAAVMGLVPRFRYVLLSDLLVETMDDRQIEAVFAHEAGHVMHRHMIWYVVFAIVFFSWLGAFETVLGWAIWGGTVPAHVPLDTILFVGGVVGFFLVFGSLSRLFERQADLFAARSVMGGDGDSAVQTDGVIVFNSALAHVARMNHMPLDAQQFSAGRGRIGRAYARAVHHAGTWLHGSIRSRMDYLASLPNAPETLAQFDRRMTVIRIGLLVALCSTTAWVITSMAY
jgi:STE24 endopeptidase